MALTLLRHASLDSQYQGCYNGWTDLDIAPELFEETKIALKKVRIECFLFFSFYNQFF